MIAFKQKMIQKLQDIYEIVDDWVKQYALIFAPDKYKLIHFINLSVLSNLRDAEEQVLILLGVEIGLS